MENYGQLGKNCPNHKKIDQIRLFPRYW